MTYSMPIGPCPARVMIVREAPPESEKAGGAFSGYASKELGKMLAEAGIMLSSCFCTNVVRFAPPGNDMGSLIAEKKSDITPLHVSFRDKFVLPGFVDGVAMLKREIEMCQPNLIVAVGNAAMWALTGEWGITSWRGSTMLCDLPLAIDYQPKVLPVYHPAMVLRQWEWRPIVVSDLRRIPKLSQSREFIPPDYSIVIPEDYHHTHAILQTLLREVERGPLPLACDVETRAGHIDTIGIAWSTSEALVIPLMRQGTSVPYWEDEEQEVSIQYDLYRLLTHPNAKVIGQNFSYDAQYFMRHMCYVPRLTHDTMIAQHTCFSNLQKSLDFLASMYCENYVYWKGEISGDDQTRWRYNGKDCCITYEVNIALQRIIDSLGMREVYTFQMTLWWPVLWTMIRGLKVNHPLRATFAYELFEEIAKREQWLIDVLGEPLNIKSPPQMKGLFYEALGQKPIFDRKTGSPTCNDEALRTISEREPLLQPLTRKVSELRSLGVFLSTFVNAPTDVDGRLRCSFNIAGTETYRFSSSKNAFGSGLNLQNIPKGGEAGDGLELPNVRNLFVPDPGYSFFDIDLASADLRIVVWESDEPEMKSMLREGLDPYTEIAKEFYHDASITKKDPRRQTFKSFAHGTNYLGTAKGLAERLGLSVKEAEATQKWYFSRFPKIKKWQNDLKDQVVKRRMVQNIFGYRCYFFGRIEGTIFNEAAAWIPQSTVGCLINRAYVNIARELPEVQILLQVHDSLAGQVPTARKDYWVEQILKQSEIILPYADPLIIPVGCKVSDSSWGGCE